MKQRKRMTALLMAGVMLLSSLPAEALGARRQSIEGLCKHHPAHTEACGYVAGTYCDHQHTEACYVFETDCVHEHGADCYVEDDASDDTATRSNAKRKSRRAKAKKRASWSNADRSSTPSNADWDEDEPNACDHVCSKKSGCIKKKLDCQHEHKVNGGEADGAETLDNACGYVLDEGAACTFVCEICPLQEVIDELPTADELRNMSVEEQQAVYEKLQEAYDAYEKLTDEQKAEITGAEIFESLFEVFNSMVNVLTEEQFLSLDVGKTYWFDLSDEDIGGIINKGDEYDEEIASVPDSTLTWVPFTYVGTINAYSRDGEGASAEDNVKPYDHSLFIADYVVTHSVSWDDLNSKNMIFGTDYDSGGVTYTLRAPSVGSDTEWKEIEGETIFCGVPKSNEWDEILNKGTGYIKNWNSVYSWGQDDWSWGGGSMAVSRGGYFLGSNDYAEEKNEIGDSLGFRPVLEIQNPDMLGTDSLKVVKLNLNGGKIGDSEEESINIVVKSDKSFTAPSSDALTRPEGSNDFYWLGSDYNIYKAGEDVPASVTELVAQWNHSLPNSGTYWFDLSDVGIACTVSEGDEYDKEVASVPDTTLTWVPFTYVGTINAYSRKEKGESTEDNVDPHEHSLLIADYVVTHGVSWDDLNSRGMIFGKKYTSGGMGYTLRAPSVGSNRSESYDNDNPDMMYAVPECNEWDMILDKNTGYIKNWSEMPSWGQDSYSEDLSMCVSRGGVEMRCFNTASANAEDAYAGFRPVLEISDADSLREVELNLNGWKIGSTDEGVVKILVKSGEKFAAPSSDGLTCPAENDGDLYWLGNDGRKYMPDAPVPASVTKLTAQRDSIFSEGETYWFDLSGEDISGTVNEGNGAGVASVPDTTLTWVPFTYVGMIEAYSRKGKMESMEDNVEPYAHSLFIADYVVSHSVSWNELNSKGMIFGKKYSSGGVSYTLRAPSMGGYSEGSDLDERGVPESNEWDMILNKDTGCIKNWSGIRSWGQDSYVPAWWDPRSTVRGDTSVRGFNRWNPDKKESNCGFRPLLEISSTLEADSLQVIELDLNGWKIGSTDEGVVKIVVKSGEEFTAPSSKGLTCPTENDDVFYWLADDGNTYMPDEKIPVGVTKLVAQGEFSTLFAGETYWFNLSNEGISGKVNSSVPDTTLTWVPFTYVGIIEAYSRDEEGVSTAENVEPYNHSLFIADYVVKHDVSWDVLDSQDMIFGKDYTSGGVTYKLRAPSVGSDESESFDYDNPDTMYAVPESNEWDMILNQNINYIKNAEAIWSWGQDAYVNSDGNRSLRGWGYTIREFNTAYKSWDSKTIGFRPVLEIKDGDDGDLNVVMIKLSGGKIGSVETVVKMVVGAGKSFTAPSGDGLTAPEGKAFDFWVGDDGENYASGDSVPAGVTKLSAQWKQEPIFYISYDWEENEQALERSDEETTEPYTLITDDNNTTEWNSGWYVVEGEVNLGSRVMVSGNVHLILKDECFLNAGGGIQVETGSSLTIYAQSEDKSTMGRLTATGAVSCAGIGGYYEVSSGTITINGGTVEATGGTYGAGIGGGEQGAGESITINGGSVKATGGTYGGAGIGGGWFGAGEGITINGGTVTATGGAYGTGIGGGDRGAGEGITINGGSVKATGGAGGAGIGGGYCGAGEGITINGGTVTATGGSSGAGIGSGFYGAGESITINGGTVTATSEGSGAGIGGGSGVSGGNIIIANGSVKASSISTTPTDGKGNNVYLAKMKVQIDVKEVTVDSEKTFKRAGEHFGGDKAFYLYLTKAEKHKIEIEASDAKYMALWNDKDGFDVKQFILAPMPTVEIERRTASSITVKALEDQNIYGDAEYRLDDGKWSKSNQFSNLHSNTEYTVSARYKGKSGADCYCESSGEGERKISTKQANYTITIPATLEAGNSAEKAELKPSEAFDLGCGGTATVTIRKGDSVTEDAKLNLTRQNDARNHTITTALLVNETALGDIDKSVAEFTMRDETPVSVSFAKPTEPDIPAGTYKGTITFAVSYSETGKP